MFAYLSSVTDPELIYRISAGVAVVQIPAFTF